MAGLALAALVVGKLSAERPSSAIKLVALPIILIAVVAPSVPVAAGVAALPYQVSIFGTGGLLISAADVLLLIGLGGVVLAALSKTGFKVSALSPIAPAGVLYFFALTIVWVNLPTKDGVVTIVQRTELVIAALVVGAFLAHRDQLDRTLTLYVLSVTVLAGAAIFAVLIGNQEPESFLGVQKNPAGQSIANALLIVVFQRKIPARGLLGTVLLLGLVSAQSRGAILATLIAVGIAAVLTTSDRRVRALAIAPVVVGIFYAGYSALPAAQQERLLNLDQGGDVATEIRQEYADDATAKFKSEPVLGTGLGLYESGSRLDLTYTDDPHNVLLLEVAEGGVVLGGAFTLLTLSSARVLIRRRSRHPIVIVALAVQISTVIHGVVDVYWVRGTPVMGWLLVGAALYLSAHKTDDPVDEDPVQEPAPVGRLG